MNKLLKDLPELQQAGVITPETAERIRAYYAGRKESSHSRLLIVFSILGAILVGLGIVLIIAHNWDAMSMRIKTVIAFLPMLAGQSLCAFALLRKKDSPGWREGTSAFLFFGVAAAISLISQIYNIPGKLDSFLITWSLLCLPIIYIMRSSVASLLYICTITWYAIEKTLWHYPGEEAYYFWLMLAAAAPHYYYLYRYRPHSNFFTFHSWVLVLSLLITLGTLADINDRIMNMAYIALYSLFCIIGRSPFFRQRAIMGNAYLIIGSLSMIVHLLVLSFRWFWKDISNDHLSYMDIEMLVTVIVSAAALLLFIANHKKSISGIHPTEYLFLLFIPVFMIGHSHMLLGMTLINVFIFFIGIYTIREGARKDHLGILNYGLLIITALIVCRFFDTNIPYIVRGILFLAVGAGFFVGNYLMIKKRKEMQEERR